VNAYKHNGIRRAPDRRREPAARARRDLGARRLDLEALPEADLQLRAARSPTRPRVALALRGGYVNDRTAASRIRRTAFGVGYKLFDIDFASIPQAKDPDTGQRLARVSKFSLAAHF
jgi:hypothetical protein